jgi:hypothetical protein
MELRDLLAKRELSNGFANRFLMIWSERAKVMPFPQATPQDEVDALADQVIKVLKFSGANRPVETDKDQMHLTAEARRKYGLLYQGELNQDTGSPLVTTLLERRAPMLLRLAMLFALCDSTHEVDVRHIDAAMAWIRYWSDSVRFVFASAEDEAQAAQVSEASEKIIAFLGQRDRATRTEISRDCFVGHAKAADIDAALDELLTASPPAIVVTPVPRPKTNPGAATKYYSLVAKSAKSANCEDSRGFAGDPDDANSCEICEISPTSFRTLRTVRSTDDPTESRAKPHVSHNSQISQGGAEISGNAEVF